MQRVRIFLPGPAYVLHAQRMTTSPSLPSMSCSLLLPISADIKVALPPSLSLPRKLILLLPGPQECTAHTCLFSSLASASAAPLTVFTVYINRGLLLWACLVSVSVPLFVRSFVWVVALATHATREAKWRSRKPQK